MSIQVRLDHSALIALFPEGSEARVELSKAVIAQFTQTVFKKHMPEDAVAAITQESNKLAAMLSEAIKNTRQEIIQNAALTHGLVKATSGGYSKPAAVLSDETVASIRQIATSHFNTEVRDATLDAINKRVEEYAERPGRFDAEIAAAVKKILDQHVLHQVQKALNL